MFEKDFKNFMEIWEDPEFIFLARPDQTLVDHISNIFIELKEYLRSYLSFSTQINKIIQISLLISTITHDFGKILPHFQYKIYREINNRHPSPIPSSEIKFSYHTLISALFSICLCDVICDFANHEKKIQMLSSLDGKYKISENELKIIKYLVFNTILNHHSPYIFENYIEFISDFRSEDFNVIFSYISSVISNIHNFFENLSEKINIAKENPTHNSNLPFYDLYQKELNNLLKKAFIKFKNDLLSLNPQNPLDMSYRYRIKKDFKKIENIKKGFNSSDSINLYVLQIFVASLLCDLDIWDARFFPKENAKQHEFPFSPPFKSFKDENIIVNFVSKPFSKFSQKLKKFEPEEPKNVIYELRNQLFKKANEEELDAGGIFMLSSPTGAGKTLTLLNLAVKLSCKYEKKYSFRPKIIYGLPFISIGSQVANQISDIFENKDNKKILSSSLLTIDNYVSDISWREEYKNGSKLHEEEIKMIYGKDAKWLISTWRSEFVVTTFVKIFNSLIKPLKKNFLKFHRLANSIIILDEVQCLPIKYWGIIGKIVENFSHLLNSTFILSTATLPAIIHKDDTEMIAKDHLKKMVKISPYPNEIELCQAINRYTIFYFEREFLLGEFIDSFLDYVSSNPNKDILLVLNTKWATIKTFQELSKVKLKNTKIELLSTLVLPKDRQHKIEKIKFHLKHNTQLSSLDRKKKRIIVISTQVIEAGVDFSFSVVFRDFAPLDSIIQVAGRCNRNLEYDDGGLFFLMKLIDPSDKNNRLFFHRIYENNMVKNITENILKKASSQNLNHEFFGKYFKIEEPQLRSEFDQYFKEIVKPNTTRVLCKEFKNLKFNLLSQNFNLIEGYPNQVDLFIPIDTKAKKIHKGLIKGHINAIPNKFYRYTITINENILQSLQTRNIVSTCLDNDKILYYYLKEEYIPEWYSKTTGFIYNKDIDTGIPQTILKNLHLN